MVNNKRVYVCYNSKSVKLGEITVAGQQKNHRAVFLEHKEEIKRTFPGTAFIKLKN